MVTRAGFSAAAAPFGAALSAPAGIPSADTPAGTKLAKATTKAIIVFPMAALTCGYGPQDPYSGKGLRPLFQVVREILHIISYFSKLLWPFWRSFNTLTRAC